MGEGEIRMVPLPPLREVPRVEMDAAGARSAAEALRQSGTDLDALYDDAAGSWRGLGSSFHVDGLAAQGGQAPEDEAPRIAAEIDAFNGDCEQMEQDWASAQQAFEGELSGISGGEAEQLPAVMDAIDTAGLRDLAQVSCTGPVDPRTDEVPGATRWLFSLRKGVPDLDAAKTTAEPARVYVEEHGWTVDVGPGRYPGGPVTTVFIAQHAETGLDLNAEYHRGGGESVLIVHGGGGCIEIPKDQLMVRSPLDGSFGDGSPGYDQDAERADPDYREPTFHPDAGPATQHRGVGD